MSEEQEIASQEPTAETPVITSEKTKEDTQEDSPDVTEETQDVDLLGLDNEEVKQDEAADDSNDIIQESEDVQQETEESPTDEIEETVIDDNQDEPAPDEDTEEVTAEEPQSEEIVVEDTDAAEESNAKETENVDPEPVAEETVDDTPSEDVAATEQESEPVMDEAAIEEETATEEEESPSPANEESAVQEEETLLEDVPMEKDAVEEEEAPMEDVPIEENTVKEEVVVQDAETPQEETPMEDVAIEEVEPQSANEETEVEEESPVEDVPIEEAVEDTPLKDVPIEDEELSSAANEETVVEVEDAYMEDVPIEEAAVEDVMEGAAMEDVPIEQEVEDEASELIPEAPVDIIGDDGAQEPVEEETTIPTVESKDLEEALEETEEDANLNAEAEELAQAVDRNINIDPAFVASAGVATAAVGAVAATSIAKEEAPEAQDSNLIRPIVIAGPSGAGKGTLIEGLMKRFPNDQFGFSVSHTTRKPREGEVNGVHYNFTSVESIKAEIDAGKFIEYAEVHGNYYGTSVDAVKSVQEQGKVCILDIDVQGVRNVKKSSLKPYYIFIAPPSMEDLEARLRGRGTEKEEDIQKRLANAADEIQFGKEPGNFDKYLVNGNLAFAANDLAGYVKKWYPHLKEVAVDQKESNFVQDCVTTATETCIIS